MTEGYSNLAAVVVHYESPDSLLLTIRNLSQHLDPQHIIIVDNSSSLVDAELGSLAVILNDGGNRGYAGGVNHGVKYIATHLSDVSEVLVCTHEAIFRRNALRLLLKTAAEHPGGHIVGPKLVTVDDSGKDIIWSNGGSLPPPFF